MRNNVIRLAVVAVATLVAIGAFTLLSHGDEEHHDAHAAEEHHHGEEDFQNIPLTARQVETINLKTDSVAHRELEASVRANGTLVLRPQSVGNVASLMGGVVRSVLVKDGQHVTRG